MAMVLTGGHDAFSALVYGQPDPSFSNFIQQFNHVAPQYVLPAAQQFFESMRGTFKTFDENMVVRRSKATIRKMANLWQLDGIVPLQNMGQFQQATPTMQRWVMACPEVRHEFHAQRCDGYNGSYVDYEPHRVAEQHYDYRRATNGLYLDNTNQGSTATTWIEELYPGDNELSFNDQMDIEETWHFARQHILARADDPTSKENNSL